MPYRNHYENLTSALQRLCYLSETTPRNANLQSFVPMEGGLVLWPFPPSQTEGENNSKEEPSHYLCSFRRALDLRDLDDGLDSYSAYPLN